VLKSKSISKFLIIKNVNIVAITKVIINEFLFSIFDLIHLSLGPRLINNKNGIKKGNINFWKKGGPTDTFSEDITSRKIG
tara:strand:+ start:1892 stop:2131 length:240 start_codon:yes stop_codon:yes gene_type:complete